MSRKWPLNSVKHVHARHLATSRRKVTDSRCPAWAPRNYARTTPRSKSTTLTVGVCLLTTL